MFIKIDVREADLIKSCNFLIGAMQCFADLKIVTESLPIGDVIICSESKTDGSIQENIIIERKSLRDLSASIKDGRYEEQSYRLNGLPHHNHNIVYLVEGYMEKMNIFKGPNDKMMLYSSMISINYFKGFSLWRSGSIDESALIICNCAYKLAKGEKENKKPYYKYEPKQELTTNAVTSAENIVIGGTSSQPLESLQVNEPKEVKEDEKDYCSVIKKVKKENITPGNIGEIMLCQIPSISSITAIAILEQYKTLPNLLECLKADSACLKNISYKTPAGQTRKISKTCIENILKYFQITNTSAIAI